MNWEAIGAVGEVVGAIAVVVTLVYLTLQLKQNTQSVQNSAWQAIIRVLTDLDVTEATDPQLSTFIRMAEAHPEQLSEDQYWKFSRIATRQRPAATPEPFSVWTSSVFPVS